MLEFGERIIDIREVEAVTRVTTWHGYEWRVLLKSGNSVYVSEREGKRIKRLVLEAYRG